MEREAGFLVTTRTDALIRHFEDVSYFFPKVKKAFANKHVLQNQVSLSCPR